MEIVAWLILIALFLGVFCPLLAFVVCLGSNLKAGYLWYVGAGVFLTIVIFVLIAALVAIGLILKWAVATVGL